MVWVPIGTPHFVAISACVSSASGLFGLKPSHRVRRHPSIHAPGPSRSTQGALCLRIFHALEIIRTDRAFCEHCRPERAPRRQTQLSSWCRGDWSLCNNPERPFKAACPHALTWNRAIAHPRLLAWAQAHAALSKQPSIAIALPCNPQKALKRFVEMSGCLFTFSFLHLCIRPFIALLGGSAGHGTASRPGFWCRWHEYWQALFR